MDLLTSQPYPILAVLGLLAGLFLLVRGMGSYRTATRVGDTSTSAIATMAAGEVRISGVIEAAEVTLVSPLQSRPCVYYRASIDTTEDLPDHPTDYDEERAIGFRVRDDSGDVRVFPHGARIEAPITFDERTGSFGETPAGLDLRTGGPIAAAEPDHAAAIDALLTVRVSARPPSDRSTRRYRESRLAPGDLVTVLGRAMPFSDLSDPAEADIAIGHALADDDPEVAANIAEARAAGMLVDPDEAWGNAAIPGFGIGRPVSAPALDPDAAIPALAPAEDVTHNQRTFTIAPETLVIAAAPGVPLLIAHGAPAHVETRFQDRFILGLLGGVLAIGSAIVLAVQLTGSTAP